MSAPKPSEPPARFDAIARAKGRPAFPVVVSGPSGVGKTVLVQRLLALDPTLTNSVSATSRPIRPGEVDGVHYQFYPPARFRELIDQGGLLEWAQVHDHFYGTPRAPLEAHLARGVGVVLNIDVQGGRQLRLARSDALLIFLVPPSLAVLEERLRRRKTDDEATIARRIANAAGELDAAAGYDYLVVNEDVDAAAEELWAIVRAERRRLARLGLLPAGGSRSPA